MKLMDKNVTERGKKIIKNLYNNNVLNYQEFPSMNRVIGYAKGDKIMFKRLKNDFIRFIIDFSSDWNDGATILFKIVDDKPVFVKVELKNDTEDNRKYMDFIKEEIIKNWL